MTHNSFTKWKNRNIRDNNSLLIKDNNTNVVAHINSWTRSKIEDIQDQDHLVLQIILHNISIKSIFLKNIKIDISLMNSTDQSNRNHHIS